VHIKKHTHIDTAQTCLPRLQLPHLHEQDIHCNTVTITTKWNVIQLECQAGALGTEGYYLILYSPMECAKILNLSHFRAADRAIKYVHDRTQQCVPML